MTGQFISLTIFRVSLHCDSAVVMINIHVFLWPQRFRTEFSEGKITGRVSAFICQIKALILKSLAVFFLTEMYSHVPDTHSVTTATSTTGATRGGL